MKKTFLRGMLSILPLALSVWLFWSIIVTLDDLGLSFLQLIGWHAVWDGVGFLLIFCLILVVGLAFSVSPILWLYQKFENQMMRFPLFKTVYGAFKDLASLAGNDDSELNQRQTVLMAQTNGSYIVGFITADKMPEALLTALPEEGDWVPVLFQLSYQIAGVTSLVRRADLIYVDWSFEEAMRFMLTAGVSQSSAMKKPT
ncbi:DUF502 domain-containing protein [Reinekea forsetii]|nr:DUF502 domain-containing protein [Reinekea forsetii]